MDEALVLVIENSDTNIGVGETYDNDEPQRRGKEPLEEESLTCVESWRKNAGIFKDIPIYVICPSEKVPKRETISELVSMGCIYIEKYFPETENFTCGYWNVPLACSWFQGHCPYEYIIHIDLDMRVLRPFDNIKETFLKNPFTPAIVGVIPENDKKAFQPFNINYNFETNFIFARRLSNFYSFWWYFTKEIEALVENGKMEIPERFHADIEEYAVDYMYWNNWQLSPLKYYQVGHRYREKDIPPQYLEKVYFHHNHPYEPTDEYEKYTKRLLEWRRISSHQECK